MAKKFEIYDLETLSNLFTYTGYDCSSGKWYQYVISAWRNDAKELIDHLVNLESDYYQVGFNNEAFDYPIIHLILSKSSYYSVLEGQFIAQELYAKAQSLINDTDTKFKTIKDSEKYIPQIDLYKIWHYNNKARSTSLKDLEICLRMPSVEEMPIHHSTWCKEGDEECVLSYNKNDVYATFLFFKTTLGKTDYSIYKGKNKMKLRQDLKNKFNVNVLNMSDVGMGETLMLHLYSRAVKKNYLDVKKLRTKRTSIELEECIPFWADRTGPLTKQFINMIKDVSISVPFEKGCFQFSLYDYNIPYKWDFGLGGSHGCIEPGIYESNDYWIIKDYDVGLA